MTMVGMHEAKTNLSRLVNAVEAGGEVVISRNGQPVVRLVRVEPDRRRGFGAMAGTGTVDDLTWDEIAAGDVAAGEQFA